MLTNWFLFQRDHQSNYKNAATWCWVVYLETCFYQNLNLTFSILLIYLFLFLSFLMSFKVMDPDFNPYEGRDSENMCKYHFLRKVNLFIGTWLKRDNLRFCNYLDGTGIRRGFCRCCQRFQGYFDCDWLVHLLWVFYFKSRKSRLSTENYTLITISSID